MPENITHLILECEVTNKLWQNLGDVLKKTLGHERDICLYDIIFGIKPEKKHRALVNIIGHF